MKKSIFSPVWAVLCLSAAVLLWGCEDTTETVYVDFSLSRYSVVFPVNGGTNTVTVGTEDSWSASTNAEWLTLNVDGSTLYITAEANTDVYDVRETVVTVATATYGSETISVRQESADGGPFLTVSNSQDSSIDSEGGSFTIAVTTNCEWEASLVEQIAGWTMSVDETAGLVRIDAEQNSGEAITGTVRVTAHSEEPSVSGGTTITEDVVVTQISRAENPYYQFVGHWDVYSSDCYYNSEWLGEGVNCEVDITEYSYPGLMGFWNWGYFEGVGIDNLNFDAGANKLTMPLGYLAGSVYTSSSFYPYYLYFVAFSEQWGFSSGTTDTPYLEITMSDDGTASFSDVYSVNAETGDRTDYPIFGYVGYNSYNGYIRFSNFRYCMAPVTLTKSEGSQPTALGVVPSAMTICPVTELPEGVPARLPLGFEGKSSVLEVF
ncbi:MAG: hypothetical protein LUD72_10990 [Bacteroidales bacterium]|nr:hypothetical protein [Bacteroidales bacterium]